MTYFSRSFGTQRMAGCISRFNRERYCSCVRLPVEGSTAQHKKVPLKMSTRSTHQRRSAVPVSSTHKKFQAGWRHRIQGPFIPVAKRTDDCTCSMQAQRFQSYIHSPGCMSILDMEEVQPVCSALCNTSIKQV